MLIASSLYPVEKYWIYFYFLEKAHCYFIVCLFKCQVLRWMRIWISFPFYLNLHPFMNDLLLRTIWRFYSFFSSLFYFLSLSFNLARFSLVNFWIKPFASCSSFMLKKSKFKLDLIFLRMISCCKRDSIHSLLIVKVVYSLAFMLLLFESMTVWKYFSALIGCMDSHMPHTNSRLTKFASFGKYFFKTSWGI